MTVCSRYRNPWSTVEVNRLYNEYELQKLPILDIAKLHKRGEHAILHRLAKEGLILEGWSDVRGWSPEFNASPVVKSPKKQTVNTVFFTEESQDSDDDDDDVESLEDNDDPYDSDYVYESDEDDADDDSVVESEDDDSDSDYVDEEESVDSDSDYEDESESKNEEFDPYSIKQKAKFMNNIIEGLKFFIYASP
jgi:hypothetical protein